MTKHTIDGLATTCPFCGDKPRKNMPVFQVSGPYTGAACGEHLAILIRQAAQAEDKLNLHVQAG